MIKTRQVAYLMAFFFLLGCGGQKGKDGQHLTVIIKNRSLQEPVVVFLERGARPSARPEAYVSGKLADTVRIPLNGFEYVYFSTRKSLADTLIAGPGDTLYLTNTGKVTPHHIVHDQRAAEEMEEVRRYFSRLTPYQGRIDTLTRIFYRVDTGPPLKTYGEHQIFADYPVHIEHEAFVEHKKELENLVRKLLEVYFRKMIFLERKKALAPANLLGNNEQYMLYKRLSFLYRFSRAPFIKHILTSDIFLNDRLVQSPFFLSILGMNNGLMVSAAADRSGAKLFINYKEAYDKAPRIPSDTLAKYSRYIALQQMLGFGESYREIKSRFSNFVQTYRDARLNHLLESKYLFSLDRYKEVTSDVQLINSDNQLFTLKQLLAELRGRKVYIDFWASWCAPCREAFPASFELIRKHGKKKLAYVYLSIDAEKEAWTKAVRSERLDGYAYNFLVLNSRKATFFKELGLSAIPRYLLYDEQGKLVHQDAPGPGGMEIQKLLGR